MNHGDNRVAGGLARRLYACAAATVAVTDKRRNAGTTMPQ
jgi:hypothetical protein